MEGLECVPVMEPSPDKFITHSNATGSRTNVQLICSTAHTPPFVQLRMNEELLPKTNSITICVEQ